ncbi:MAG TPA: VCBS repeat-containing protein [Blastocatellia bacterium]|nr:VCBS repeat-containing protein [Blastocatellia bacterium]
MRSSVFILLVTLALHAVACRGVAVHEQFSGAASNHAPEQSSPAPQVSGEFQPAIAQLAAEGLRIKEAVEANLEAGARHLAATFERAGAKEAAQRYEFRILESDGRAAKTVFRRTDFFFSFAATGELQKLNGTDINGDGLNEIIVQSSSGGNCWSCNPTEIYQVRNHKGVLVAAGPIQRVADLNGDGTRELIVADTRWESYDDLSHAASPTALMVYAWRGGRYVYASKDFAEFYRTEVARLRAAIDEAKADITAEDFSDEAYVGLALALTITYAHAGETERGVKELEALLNANARSAAQSKHRAQMLEDFRSGESNKKLREMKAGGAMPLG